jgi:hypothetical protein
MEIGKPRRTYTIEPVRAPVPREAPKEPERKPDRERAPRPDKTPR